MNRTQKYFFETFENDLNDDAFYDLVFIIEKIFKYNSYNNKKDDTHHVNDNRKKILNELSKIIANNYFELANTYFLHKDFTKWCKKGKEWKIYNSTINESNSFMREGDVKMEISRLFFEYEKTKDLGNSLAKK